MIKIILIIVLSATTILVGNVKDEAERAIAKNINIDEIIFSKYELNVNLRKDIEKKCRQKFFGSYVYLWKIFEKNELNHIVLLDNVLGKAQPISFIVIFDLNGKIVHTEIIKYREDHGGQIQNKIWLEQFLGRDYRSSFKVGKDIDGISGATISVLSLSTGINKLCLLVNELLQSE